MRHTLIALGCILLLAGCVQPVAKIAQTPTGRPELVIRADVPAIKAEILNTLVNYGYTVEQDTETTLRLSRPLNGMEDVGAALAVGNSYSQNRRVTVYTFIKQGDGAVRVIVSSSWAAQMPFGQTRTGSEMADEGNVFNTFQRDLEQMKAKLEGGRL